MSHPKALQAALEEAISLLRAASVAGSYGIERAVLGQISQWLSMFDTDADLRLLMAPTPDHNKSIWHTLCQSWMERGVVADIAMTLTLLHTGSVTVDTAAHRISQLLKETK